MLAGAVLDAAADDTAFVHRNLGFDVVLDMFFLSLPGAAEAVQGWLTDMYDNRCVPRSVCWPCLLGDVLTVTWMVE